MSDMGYLDGYIPRDVQRDKLKQRGEKQRSGFSIVKKPRKALAMANFSMQKKRPSQMASRKEIRPTEIS